MTVLDNAEKVYVHKHTLLEQWLLLYIPIAIRVKLALWNRVLLMCVDTFISYSTCFNACCIYTGSVSEYLPDCAYY